MEGRRHLSPSSVLGPRCKREGKSFCADEPTGVLADTHRASDEAGNTIFGKASSNLLRDHGVAACTSGVNDVLLKRADFIDESHDGLGGVECKLCEFDFGNLEGANISELVCLREVPEGVSGSMAWTSSRMGPGNCS
jgi:hypothetical protein